MNRNIAIAALGIAVMCFQTLSAQSSFKEYSTLRAEYPEEDYVLLKVEKSLDISLKKDSLLIEREVFEEGMILGDKSTYFENRSAHSSRFSRMDELEAYSLIPRGSSYTKRKVKDFTTSDFVNGGIFHDDSQETNFRFSGLTKGAKTVYRTKHSILDPHLMPLLTVSMYSPIENATIQITHDKDVQIKATLLNADSLNSAYTREEKGKKIIHRWTFQDVPKMEHEGDAQGALYYAAQITVQISSYTNNDGEVRVLENLDDLHAWYCKFLGSMHNDDAYIQTLADSIAGDLTDTIEIVSRIYQWVQKNIKYVAFEEGYKGYIPENADAVCTNRYGDCKGMSNLLNSMLQSHGIRSNLAWVGTRDLPYRYNDLPTPNVDNHMIAVLEHDNGVYFMDPTHSNLPFGLPSPFIQEKEVLMNRNCQGYEVLQAPLTKANTNLLRDSSYLTIEGKDLVGVGTAELHGYVRMTFFDYLQEQSYDYLKRYCRSYFQKGNNKFVLDTVWLENKENSNLPLIVHYNYKIRDYVVSSGNENYLNLNLEMTEPPEKVEKDRKLPLELRFKIREEYNYTLDFGTDFTVDFLPESQSFEGEKFQFEQHYQEANSMVKRSAFYETDYILLEVQDFEPWNEYVNAVNRSFKHRMVLDKNTP